MQKDIEIIKLDGREIILIGTAHVSKASQKLVREIIEKEKPDTVGIELCSQRYKTITDKNSWKNMKITEVIKQKKTYLLFLTLIIAGFQKRIGDRLGIEPGSEMISALKTAKKNNMNVELLDRNIQVTLKRAWAKLYFFKKMKMLSSIVAGIFITDEIDEKTIEKMKDKNIINEMMEDLSKDFPEVKKTLIDERDKYLATKILETKSKKMVAVLGAGHIDGVVKHIKAGKKADLNKLTEIPKKFPYGKIIGYTIPIIFIAIIIYGFFTSGSNTSLEMLFWWFIINGTLSAVFILPARPSIQAFISAFIAAPITSLNPTIAAGWVVGLVEAHVHEPRVGDLKNLHKDSLTLKGFINNRVTKILLIVVLANLGSTIGTLIAFPYILSLLP